MDLSFIIAAFGLGFVAAWLRLPPLVGYLAAGFVLHAFGYEVTEGIELVAEFGVLLLLFGIGLKLKLTTLARPEVWGGGTIHLVASTLGIGALMVLLGTVGLPLAADLDLGQAALVGFAFSFSSTVYAVKALEDRNEASSLAGKVSIGILIIQDLFAVGFLVVAASETPSPWAIPVVVGLVAARPIYGWLLDRTGHGELLILFGFFLAIGVGAEAFRLVDLKPDLGALIIGLTLASHPRARELADRLLGYKDILLIGFFLSIGLGGAPDAAALVIALIMVVVLPLKVAGFMALIPRFRLRARTAWHAAITLATFSEFGLIVMDAGVDEGLLDQQWLAAVAVAVAASFVLAAPANTARYEVYRRFADQFDRLQREPLRPEDSLIDPGDARILIFGMGGVGSGSYDEIVEREGPVVLGVDRAQAIVTAHEEAGRRIVRGDALDVEFWERVRLHPELELVVMAMSDHRANVEAVRRVKRFLPAVKTAAVARYADEVAELEDVGVDVARNLLSEAGQGLASDACDLIDADPLRHGD
jgi:predicted Kef-type K+ transport protein